MDGGSSGSSAGRMNMMMARSPFTVSQWQELEHQALIFKYILAGLPVPPDLLLPIQKSFQSISHRFFNHPTLGYSSYFGKKVDREPGRCRRTDGKKWRCSKDAYPDSKYCERHMHRGRNRSRKPVESHTMTQSASSMTSLTATSSCSGNGSFQDLPLSAFGNVQASSTGTSQSQYQVDTIPYAIPSKDYRYLQGLASEVGEHSLFSQASASKRSLEIDSALDSGWPLAQTTMSSFLPSKSCKHSILQTEYPQHSLYGGDFATGEAAKQECQPLRPFFNEWPRTRDNWSGLEDHTSVSTTQLSISIPMTLDFSAANSQPPHGED